LRGRSPKLPALFLAALNDEIDFLDTPLRAGNATFWNTPYPNRNKNNLVLLQRELITYLGIKKEKR
jgi:hypothetical protein